MDLKCTNTPFLLLMQTSKAIQDRIRDEMTKNNLSVTEFSALEVLYFKEKTNHPTDWQLHSHIKWIDDIRN